VPKNHSIAVSTAVAAALAFVVETPISPWWSGILKEHLEYDLRMLNELPKLRK
jgi:hypothetical protein